LGFNSFAQVANELDCRTQGLYVAQVFRQASLLYVGAGAVVALGALWLIVPLFGREFAPAVGPALVLVLYTSLVSLGNVLNEGMRGQAHTAPGVSAQLLASALIALAAWNLVPRFGLLGMAWSCVLGGVAQLAVLLYAAMSRFTLSSSDFWGLRFHEVKALYGRLQTLKITS
jgi:O-antigen/teichoic acid export membrane protein